MTKEELLSALDTVCHCCADSAAAYPTKELAMIARVLIAHDKLQAISDKTGDKYRWHDLRKNPNDLPKENGHYLIVYQWIGRNSGITIEPYNPYDGFCIPPEYPCVAWKEIEPFEVEVTE